MQHDGDILAKPGRSGSESSGGNRSARLAVMPPRGKLVGGTVEETRLFRKSVGLCTGQRYSPRPDANALASYCCWSRTPARISVPPNASIGIVTTKPLL